MTTPLLSLMLLADPRRSLRDNAAALWALEGQVPPEVPKFLMLTDAGQAQTLLPQIEGRDFGVIRIEARAPERGAASNLLRAESGSAYGLVLGVEDRLCSGALERLCHRLQQAGNPDLVVLGEDLWLADPNAPLPGPDAQRRAALPQKPSRDDLLRLFPDPRRLLWRGETPQLADPWTQPDAAWACFETALLQAEQPLFLRRPCLLRRPAAASPAAGFATLATGTPDAQHRRLRWLGDLLPATGADQTPALLAAAAEVLPKLPPALLETAEAGPARDLLRLLQQEGPSGARSLLALEMAQQQARRQAALEQAYAELRRDLDLALPGPAYLADLYARLRDL